MLREKERGYLELERPRYLNKPKTDRIRKRDADVRNKAKKAIAYLEYLATHLVPDQHEQVFNEKTVLPLINAVFSEPHPEWKPIGDSVISDPVRFRLAVAIANICTQKALTLIDADLRMTAKGTNRRLFPEPWELNLLATFYHYPQIFKGKKEVKG